MGTTKFKILIIILSVAYFNRIVFTGWPIQQSISKCGFHQTTIPTPPTLSKSAAVFPLPVDLAGLSRWIKLIRSRVSTIRRKTKDPISNRCIGAIYETPISSSFFILKTTLWKNCTAESTR